MQSQEELFLNIAPDKFHYLKFILEGYDNLAILSSCGEGPGLVRLRYISSARTEVMQLLSNLASDL